MILLAASLPLFSASAADQPRAPAPPDIRIILLGTGGPELTPDRLGTATLVEAGGQMLLFDAGRGVLQRMYESRIEITGVTHVFLTHLHSDHFEGLPELWMTGWFLLGRDHPMQVWGPVGTKAMVAGMLQMYGHDVAQRQGASPRENMTTVGAHEFADGLVYERDGLRVTAFGVEHMDGNPAFGYKIAYKGRIVVLSGDTTYSDNVVNAAKGADVLIHNVIAASDAYLAAAPAKRAVMAKLATPEQAASVFSQAKPRLAVYSHVIRLGLTDADIEKRTRAAGYAGPLVVGRDGMVVEVGWAVVVHPPQSLAGLKDVTRPGDDRR